MGALANRKEKEPCDAYRQLMLLAIPHLNSGGGEMHMGGLVREKPERLIAIDLLRGIAVLTVVLHHLPFSWRGLSDATSADGNAFGPALVAALHFGAYGVHLFLVISGFCIHLPWARRGDLSAKLNFSEFWFRRMRRLYPPYLVTLLFTAILLFAGQVVLRGRSGAPLVALGYASGWAIALDALFLLFLLQNLNGASWRVGNGPLWTLALEEQLYVLYFPLLALRRRWGWPTTLVVVALATTGWRLVAQVLPPAVTLPAFWLVVGPARWLEWALGALAVEAHLGLVQLPRWARNGAAGACLLALAIGLDAGTQAEFAVFAGLFAVIGDACFGLAFFVLVNTLCAIEREGRLPRWAALRSLSMVGVFSYSIYLVHDPLMAGVKRFLVSSESVSLVVAARLLAAIGGGYVFHILVERRFLNRTRTVRAPERERREAVIS